jgi:thiamine biosynthesis lipoprotein
VADPLAPEADVAQLWLEQGGVATSGRDYRRWRRGGVWQHHLLDPRTGRPAQTDVLSATVLGPSAAEAEVAAKVALILGSRAGLAWLAARPALTGVLVLADGQVRQTLPVQLDLTDAFDFRLALPAAADDR